jgi:hypothetical protein
MATRSNIGILEDGKVKAIYVHYDGYPSGVGKTLLENYTDKTKIKDLIDLGSVSFLQANITKPEGHSFNKPTKGYTVFYGRDRGEKGMEPQTYDSVRDVQDNDYTYIYDTDTAKWFWTDNYGDGKRNDLSTTDFSKYKRGGVMSDRDMHELSFKDKVRVDFLIDGLEDYRGQMNYKKQINLTTQLLQQLRNWKSFRGNYITYDEIERMVISRYDKEPGKVWNAKHSELKDYIKAITEKKFTKGGKLNDFGIEDESVYDHIDNADLNLRSAGSKLWKNKHPKSDDYEDLKIRFDRELYGDVLTTREQKELGYAKGGSVEERVFQTDKYGEVSVRNAMFDIDGTNLEEGIEIKGDDIELTEIMQYYDVDELNIEEVEELLEKYEGNEVSMNDEDDYYTEEYAKGGKVRKPRFISGDKIPIVDQFSLGDFIKIEGILKRPNGENIITNDEYTYKVKRLRPVNDMGGVKIVNEAPNRMSEGQLNDLKYKAEETPAIKKRYEFLKEFAKGGQTEYPWGTFDNTIETSGTYWDGQIYGNNNKLRKIDEFESKSFDEIRGEHRLNRNKSDKELFDEMERLRDMKAELQAENLHLYDNFGGQKEYLKWKKQQDESQELPFAKGGEVNKKENNEMLIGGIAGLLLGIFLNK